MAMHRGGNQSANIRNRYTGIIFGVVVKGAIEYDFKSPLVVIQMNLMAYYVLCQRHPASANFPLSESEPGIVFQEDNTCPHMGHVSMTVDHIEVLRDQPASPVFPQSNT